MPNASLASPTAPDAPPKMMAVVLTKVRIVRQGAFEYHQPVGSVIALKMLPPSTTFNAGADAKLIDGTGLKPGDIVVD